MATTTKNNEAPDTLVRCRHCGATQMISARYCLINTWPRCHDEAMHLEDTTADIGQIINDINRVSWRIWRGERDKKKK
jgi:hypothetical protein